MELDDDAALHVASHVFGKLFLHGVSGEHLDNLLEALTKLAVGVEDGREEEAVPFVSVLGVPLLLLVLAFGDGVSRGTKMSFGERMNHADVGAGFALAEEESEIGANVRPGLDRIRLCDGIGLLVGRDDGSFHEFVPSREGRVRHSVTANKMVRRSAPLDDLTTRANHIFLDANAITQVHGIDEVRSPENEVRFGGDGGEEEAGLGSDDAVEAAVFLFRWLHRREAVPIEKVGDFLLKFGMMANEVEIPDLAGI